MIVTDHAISRYIERIAPHMTPDEARAAIEASEPAVTKALAFGCSRVVQGNGARLILTDDGRVVTVTRHRSGRLQKGE